MPSVFVFLWMLLSHVLKVVQPDLRVFLWALGWSWGDGTAVNCSPLYVVSFFSCCFQDFPLAFHFETLCAGCVCFCISANSVRSFLDVFILYNRFWMFSAMFFLLFLLRVSVLYLYSLYKYVGVSTDGPHLSRAMFSCLYFFCLCSASLNMLVLL